MQLLVAVQTQHLCLYLCGFLSLLVNLSYLLFPGIEDLVHHSDTNIDQPGPDQTFLSSGPDQSLPSSVSGSSHSAGCERKHFYSENQINFYSEVYLHLLFSKVKQHLFPFQGQCLHPQHTLKLSETRKVISHCSINVIPKVLNFTLAPLQSFQCCFFFSKLKYLKYQQSRSFIIC